MSRTTQSETLHQLTANTIRFLAVDAINKANSGHPGMPMGMANVAAVLWAEFLNYNPEAPQWVNRDRFILSAGHGSMLLYAALHLAGYAISRDDLRDFRQWGSRTPGHPEFGETPGVETTTGPLGQGFANGVGMALAARMLGDRFATPEFSPIDHWVYGIVSDGDLMEGISHEAASTAGHLGLGKIIYFYDDNAITIEGKTDLAFSEDIEKRFQGYNWHVQEIDGHDADAIRQAIKAAQAETAKPSIIITKTHIGYGSPNKQDTAGCHGAPLGAEETTAAKANLNWPVDSTFYVPEEVEKAFADLKPALAAQEKEWQRHFDAWQKDNANLKTLWDAHFTPVHAQDLAEQILDAIPDKAAATRAMGGAALQKVAALYPGLIGGSADLGPSTKTLINDSASVTASDFMGRNLHFGIREHGMGALMNGMAAYGGVIPYGSTFFVFADYMRPPVRLAALMKLQSLFIFTHDSIFVGEDGPTHQPIEHLAVMRAIPNTVLFRPADRIETAAAYASALRREDGPTVLCLTRQNLDNIPRDEKSALAGAACGGYVLEGDDNPELVVVGTGSELHPALNAARALRKEGRRVRVVSMPSLDLYLRQDVSYRDSVIPPDCPVVVVEAGISMGWYGLTQAPMHFVGLDSFGASAPAGRLADEFGLTAEKVLQRIRQWLD